MCLSAWYFKILPVQEPWEPFSLTERKRRICLISYSSVAFSNHIFLSSATRGLRSWKAKTRIECGTAGKLCPRQQCCKSHTLSGIIACLSWAYGIILDLDSLVFIHYSWSRRDVTAYMTITIKPEKLRILRLDIWGTVSVFIVDLNADIRGGFTNLTADYQKLWLDIHVGVGI